MPEGGRDESGDGDDSSPSNGGSRRRQSDMSNGTENREEHAEQQHDQSSSASALDNTHRRSNAATNSSSNEPSRTIGGGRGGGRGGSKYNNSSGGKRLIESPASAADTGSTCSMSTTASQSVFGADYGSASWGMIGGSAGGGGVATLTSAGGLRPSGRGSINSRNAHQPHLTRRERRALRRRQRQQHSGTPAALRRQLQALSATLGTSFGLFLLFYLNLPALLFLMATIAIGTITATIGYQYLVLQYNAVLASGGFIQYLPEGVQDSLRDALSGTTLHEWMTDPAFFMENRYLLLYFLPGLDADQLDALVDRLPERHRNILRRPGYMSSMTPASVRRALIADGGDNSAVSTLPAASARSIVNSSLDNTNASEDDDARRRLFDGDNNDDEGQNDTALEYEPSTSELWGDIAATVTRVLQGSALGQRALDVIEEEEGDNDSSTSLTIERIPSDNDESVESEGDAARDEIPPTVTATLSTHSPEFQGLDASLALPSNVTSNDVPSTPQTPATLSAEEEQQIEGDILNDAMAAISRNLAQAASTSARDAFVGAVEFVTPGIVRLGLGTSVFSGFGLLGSYYVNFVRGHPLGWRRPVPRLLEGDSSARDGGDRETVTSTTRYVAYGLLSSVVFGGASAGIMLLVRNSVRRSLAVERAKSEASGKQK